MTRPFWLSSAAILLDETIRLVLVAAVVAALAPPVLNIGRLPGTADA